MPVARKVWQPILNAHAELGGGAFVQEGFQLAVGRHFVTFAALDGTSSVRPATSSSLADPGLETQSSSSRSEEAPVRRQIRYPLLSLQRID